MVLHTVSACKTNGNAGSIPLQNSSADSGAFRTQGNSQDASPIISFETDLTMASAEMAQAACGGEEPREGQQWSANQLDHERQQTANLNPHKHELKMGWDIRRPRTSGNDWATSNGTYNFSRLQTSSASGSAGAGTGHSFASFLLGDVDQASAAQAPPFLGAPATATRPDFSKTTGESVRS